MQLRYVLTAALVILTCPRYAHGGAAPAVHLQVAAHRIADGPAPYVQDHLLWGPVDAVVRCLGATVEWQAEARRLVATMPDGREFVFEAGATFFEQDGQQQPLPAPMVVSDDVLVAPLGEIIKAFGGKVSWNKELTDFYVAVTMDEPVLRGDEQGMAVELATTGLITGEVNYIDEPYRAYVDIAGAEPHSPSGKRYIGQNGVWRLRWGQFASRPAIARYVLDLAEEQEVVWLPRADGRGGSLLVGRFDGDESELPIRYPELQHTRVYQTPDESTVVEIALSMPAELDYDVLSQPWRIQVKLRDVQAPEELVRQPGCGEIVKGLEAMPTSEGIEVHIYLNELIGFDLSTPISDENWQVKLTFSKAQLCDKLIMIDPGHGGNDSGARGRMLLEKDVNLDVGTQVVQKLLAAGCPALLTRDHDVLVDLFERPKLAQRMGAHAFVSIHANAMPKPNTNWGTETYYYTPQSKMLAIVIHQQLLAALGRKDNGVRRAHFVVIRETEIPSVLVELMYLNNDEEERLLAKPEVRTAAAEAIIRGLRQYYEGRAEPESNVTADQRPTAGEPPPDDEQTNGGD